MVLAAGFGLRLRPLTLTRAKPACPVVNRPLIHFSLDRLAAAGVREAVVNTHHLPDTVRAALESFVHPDLRLTVVHEPRILGTGGGLKNARRYLEDDDVIILQNGDTIFDADLSEAVRIHRASDALATLVLLDDPRVERYGAVEIAADGAVVDIAGLLAVRGVRRGLFVGTHMLRPEIFARLPEQPVFDIIRNAYLPLLQTQPGAVRAQFGRARFFDLGAPADYLAANWALLDDPGLFAFCRDRRREIAPGIWGSEQVDVPPDVIFRAPVLLGPGVHLERGVSLGPYAIIGAGATIAKGAALERCVVWDGAKVEGRHTDAVLT
jgi:NDP-sugar pyrophosphorylase family protein